MEGNTGDGVKIISDCVVRFVNTWVASHQTWSWSPVTHYLTTVKIVSPCDVVQPRYCVNPYQASPICVICVWTFPSVTFICSSKNCWWVNNHIPVQTNSATHRLTLSPVGPGRETPEEGGGHYCVRVKVELARRCTQGCVVCVVNLLLNNYTSFTPL